MNAKQTRNVVRVLYRLGRVTVATNIPVTKLWAWLDASGYSQNQIAKAAGIARSSVALAAQGHSCGVKVARQISKVTKLPEVTLEAMETRYTWRLHLNTKPLPPEVLP